MNIVNGVANRIVELCIRFDAFMHETHMSFDWFTTYFSSFYLSQHIWIYKHGLISWVWDCFSQCVVIFPSSSFFIFDLTWVDFSSHRIESHRIASNGMSEHWRWPWASFEWARIMHSSNKMHSNTDDIPAMKTTIRKQLLCLNVGMNFFLEWFSLQQSFYAHLW